MIRAHSTRFRCRAVRRAVLSGTERRTADPVDDLDEFSKAVDGFIDPRHTSDDFSGRSGDDGLKAEVLVDQGLVGAGA